MNTSENESKGSVKQKNTGKQVNVVGCVERRGGDYIVKSKEFKVMGKGKR